MTREWWSEVSGLGSHIAFLKSGLEENSIMTIITARHALLNRLLLAVTQISTPENITPGSKI